MGKARATGGRGRARRTSATHHGSSSCTTRRAHPQKTSRLRASRTSRRASRRRTSSTSPGASTRRAPPYRTASRAAAAFACPRHRATGFPTTIVARNKSVARSLATQVSQTSSSRSPKKSQTYVVSFSSHQANQATKRPKTQRPGVPPLLSAPRAQSRTHALTTVHHVLTPPGATHVFTPHCSRRPAHFHGAQMTKRLPPPAGRRRGRRPIKAPAPKTNDAAAPCTCARTSIRVAWPRPRS